MLDKAAMANLDAIYLAAYAVGQFTWGMLADRFGPARVYGTGVLLYGVAVFPVFALFGTASIAWFTVGLVIVFAYNGDQVIAGIDLGVIGWIAIILGALAIILSLFMSRSRRPAGYTTSRTSDGPEGRRYEETRVDPDDRL